MELTKKQELYMATVEANTPEGTYLLCGWHDAEHGFDWASYCDWAKDLIDEMDESEGIGAFQTFKEWVEMKREEEPERDNLGFSPIPCELCDALAGDRHAVTAMYNDGEYETLAVCEDCLMYVANGDLPE